MLRQPAHIAGRTCTLQGHDNKTAEEKMLSSKGYNYVADPTNRWNIVIVG